MEAFYVILWTYPIESAQKIDVYAVVNSNIFQLTGDASTSTNQ